jgi:hypothetical protein
LAKTLANTRQIAQQLLFATLPGQPGYPAQVLYNVVGDAVTNCEDVCGPVDGGLTFGH